MFLPYADLSIADLFKHAQDLTLPTAPVATAARPPLRQTVDPSTLRSFSSGRELRGRVYDDVLAAASALEPISNDQYTLRLSGVRYIDPDTVSKKRRKEALLAGETLARRMRGTWELVDQASGEVRDRRDQIVARVPHVFDDGTILYRGSGYGIRHQQRLLPGVFARKKNSGELESHVNILPGQGRSHHYNLDPDRGTFKLRVDQANVPLLPLLKAMGASDQEVQDAWGTDLYVANQRDNDVSVLEKLKDRFLSKNSDRSNESLAKAFAAMPLDPEVTRRTLGGDYKNLDHKAILAATKKLLAVSRGEADVDDRDHAAYQTFLGPEDLFAERLRRDHSGIRRMAFHKIAREGNLKSMPTGLMTEQLDQLILQSGLAQALEEINPGEQLDKMTSVTRMGEGGIPSTDSIPESARSVQPTQFGYVDPVRTPESERAGVDAFLAAGARKGRDGRLYTRFQDPKTGESLWLSPQQVADYTIAPPRAMKLDWPRIPVLKAGKMGYARKDEVDVELPDMESMFSPLGNLVPGKSAMKQQRMAMASRMLTQALPLRRPEAPLVQGAMPGNPERSFEEEYGTTMGAVRASQGGRVLDVADGVMKVQYADGTTDDIELDDNLPFNRKTLFHQTPTVAPGQEFESGQLLAKSNYTDDSGVTALGTNLYSAYMPLEGYNFEDAVVISESAAAEKLTSEHAYKHALDVDEGIKTDRNSYVSLFPHRFGRQVLEKLDERGVVQTGAEVRYGDPLVLAARRKEPEFNKIHKRKEPGWQDASITWDHHDPGVVTDVAWGKAGPVVVVKSYASAQVGDKLSGRYGDKGVIAAIVPDGKMPQDSQGRPYEIVLGDDGLVSRTNAGQKVEAALGKLAAFTGRPIKIPDFEDIDDLSDWAHQQLRRAGLKGRERVFYPATGRNIDNIMTGNRFFMKLHHTGESKAQGRGGGAYTGEDAPAKGGYSGSKRVSLLDVNAYMSHGAIDNLRDAALISGQKNEDYWLQFMSGHSPRDPRATEVYNKFINQLTASGVDLVRDGPRTHVKALTDAGIDDRAGNRIITSGATVQDDDLRPVPGGLFDPKLTGGHNGRQWAAIKLVEPMPNPIMEEPIRRVLGLTQDKFNQVLAGEEPLGRYGSGPAGIKAALSDINLDREIAVGMVQFRSGRKSERDQVARRLRFLSKAREQDLHPRDWMLSKAPVLPPVSRPVGTLGTTKIPMVSDPNYLYRELIEANDNLAAMQKDVGENGVGPERLAVYHAFKAVVGLGDPVTQKSQQKGVRGILKSVFGASPKYGVMQRKLIGSTVDNVGRAVVVPDPDLDMDQLGIPENQAFDVYQRFVVRRLKRRGMPLREAVNAVEERTPLARSMLEAEMQERPVIMNRAPVLHRFGVMAFRPKLIPGDVVHVPPLVVKGFNMDFDGDAVQFRVPADKDGVEEAYERMLPSKNLLSPADFKTPMHMPGKAYAGGLYKASTLRSKKTAKLFRDREAVLAAYKRGELNVDDEVRTIAE